MKYYNELISLAKYIIYSSEVSFKDSFNIVLIIEVINYFESYSSLIKKFLLFLTISIMQSIAPKSNRK